MSIKKKITSKQKRKKKKKNTVQNQKKKKKEEEAGKDKKKKKKKKRKERQATSRRKKKKEKMCEEKQCEHGHFRPKMMYNFYLSFSLFWKENFLMGRGIKHLGSTIYFPSSPPNQTQSKMFSFPFFLQNFPYTIFHLKTNTP